MGPSPAASASWVRDVGGHDLIFYDGSCGLCHWMVRFVALRDRRDAFRFAPLAGSTFQALGLSAATGPDCDQSLLIWTDRQQLLSRSSAVLHIWARLQPPWRWLAHVGRAVPRPVRDWLYDRIASVRYRLFARAESACPVLPESLRTKFLP